MEITKVSLDHTQEEIFKCSLIAGNNGKAAPIWFKAEQFEGDRVLKLSADETMAFNMVTEGEICYTYEDGTSFGAVPGDKFTCELEESIEVSGEGKMISMHLAPGIRGSVELQTVKSEKIIKVGEIIGESCMLIFPMDGPISLVQEDHIVTCRTGEGIVVRTARRDVSQVRVVCPDGGRLVLFNCMRAFDSDFAMNIGAKIIERSYGLCKVRLDITEMHMNPIGTIHGGTLFTIADEASGHAAATTGGVCTTVDAHIEFLSSSFEPKYVIAEAKPKKIGRKIRSFTVDIRDDQGMLLCTADYVFYCLQNN